MKKRASVKAFPGFLAVVLCICSVVGTQSSFASIVPVYGVTFDDSITGDNVGNDGELYWWISPGADNYSEDLYERPTIQTYDLIDGQIATREYYENIDIVQVKAGFDAGYLYFGMELNGLNKIDGSGSVYQGLDYRYQVRLGKNPVDPFSVGGILLEAQQPSSKSNPTVFSGEKAFGYLDNDNDVGGTSLYIPNEGGGSGYDLQVIADGEDQTDENKPIVLLTRVNPNNANIVEFAFDYKAFGYTEEGLLNLEYLVFSADKGLDSISSFLWNDKWNEAEAGTPYETGTQNIYEVDSLTGGPIPEPATIALLGLGGLLSLRNQRFRQRRNRQS